jgi:ankyrin repeat protein
MASIHCLLLLLTLLRQADAPTGLRMIVVRTEADANNVLARLRGGEKFDELAQKLSVDSSARAGGYLGALTTSQLRPEFQAALQGVSPGQPSPVVRIGREYAVLQLLTTDETQAIELKIWSSAGADPKSPMLQGLWTMAIAANDSAMVKRLIDSGADVNAAFADGSNVLMGAAQAGEIEIVRTLLAAGPLINAQARDGTTALLLAVQGGHADIVRALLDAGATVNLRGRNEATVLMDASFGGHLEILRLLLKAGAEPNLTLPDGSTALMAASGKGHNDIIRALLASGAQVNAGANTGGTALMEAAYGGHTEAVRILLDAGADPKLANPDGITALMGASLGGHTEAVVALLEAGAPISPRDKRGWTALTYGRASANSATVLALLAKMNIGAEERSIALGGTYLNEYYSSNEQRLVELAAAEFEKVLRSQPQNAAALEWMGAAEFLRWSKPPSIEQFNKTDSLFRKAVEIDPKDPDRHCWIAAISAIFLSNDTTPPAAEAARILDHGIEHARKAIELDSQFADAADYLSLLYRQKAALISTERDPLLKVAGTARQDAVRIRERLRNRPSRFNDQFSRPALPPPTQ